MTAFWISWLACHPDEPPNDNPKDTVHTGVVVTGTGDTALPCADSEVPLNGLDDDCDGWADELGLELPLMASVATPIITGLGTGLGHQLSVGQDCDGAVWAVAGGEDGWLTHVSGYAPTTGARLTITAEFDYAYFGRSIAIGCFGPAFPGVVASGDAPLPMGLFPPQSANLMSDDFSLTILGTGTQASNLLASDLDGDGFDELLVGGFGLRVVRGPPTAPEWNTVQATVTATFPPIQNFAYHLGRPIDVTGDGVPEIPVSSEEDGGRVWLVPGDVTGTVAVQDVAIAALSGEQANDDAGVRAVGGDANGDGYTDLAVSAPLAASRRGKSYLVLGPILEDRALADSAAQVVGDFDFDWCGVSQTFLPDNDGDGADDVAVGCSRDKYLGPPAPGRVQLYRGPQMGGQLGLADAERVWVGQGPYDLMGYRMDGEHDVDGDGVPDLVVSAPYDSTGGENAGTVFLLSGTDLW